MYLLEDRYGLRYELEEDGRVTRLDSGLRCTGWFVLGLVELLPFGRIGPLIPLADAVKITDLNFKNGKPRYTVADNDHGTFRIWGNTDYHGVRSLRLV